MGFDGLEGQGLTLAHTTSSQLAALDTNVLCMLPYICSSETLPGYPSSQAGHNFGPSYLTSACHDACIRAGQGATRRELPHGE
jgi:hypothetical protein